MAAANAPRHSFPARRLVDRSGVLQACSPRSWDLSTYRNLKPDKRFTVILWSVVYPAGPHTLTATKNHLKKTSDFLTANEGDSREYGVEGTDGFFTDEIRVGDLAEELGLDPDDSPYSDDALGRLQVGDVVHPVLYVFRLSRQQTGKITCDFRRDPEVGWQQIAERCACLQRNIRSVCLLLEETGLKLDQTLAQRTLQHHFARAVMFQCIFAGGPW